MRPVIMVNTPPERVPRTRESQSRPEWQWSSYEVSEDKHGRWTFRSRKIESSSNGDLEAESELDDGPFEVLYERRPGILGPDVVKVTLTSPPLVKILQQHFTEGEVHSWSNPKIKGRDCYVALQSLKNHAARFHDTEESGCCCLDEHNDKAGLSSNQAPYSDSGTSNDDVHLGSTETDSIKERKIDVGERAKESKRTQEEESGALHLKHLVRFVETEYKDVLVRERRMKEEKRASWNMLWAFLSKGTKVAYYCDHSEQLMCGVVASNKYCSFSSSHEGPCFTLELDVWNFDGEHYKACQIQRHIEGFHGERDFARLPVSPVEILGNPSTGSLDDRFLSNGKRFYELAATNANQFMLYSGPMFNIRCGKVHKENSDGRVMIDFKSFAAMNPDYPMGSARVPASKHWIKRRRVCPPTNKGGLGVECSSATEVPPFSTRGEDEEVSEESLIFAPAIAYGFSFALKKWGSFTVSGFSEITFNAKAFQELTMDPGTKRLIHNLVGQYICPSTDQGADSSGRVQGDPISKTEKRCIFLCYGPPGTGRTLTAHAIAEKMMRPLWALSVSELGTTPRELELKLVKVFEIAAKWNAVLLLDEADAYVEKRTSGCNVRNAMTGVFLRLLEYYRGVLFLITNRIDTFDDAFKSRILLFLRYPQLWYTLDENDRGMDKSERGGSIGDVLGEDGSLGVERT